ncbi:MAG TPA: sugar ABC transporter permease [Herpetosiphonaceae bacterium]
MLFDQPTRQRPTGIASTPVRVLTALVSLVITLFAFGWSFQLMRDPTVPRWLTIVVALVMGVGGIWMLFWAGNQAVNVLSSSRSQERWRSWVFVGPAIAVLAVYLVYPMFYTIWLSFFDKAGAFAGIDNYVFAFTDKEMRGAFVTNIYWLLLVTTFSVSLGLIIAVLLDRVRYESAAKSLIFLPMVISFVGASVIWKFIYAFQPKGRPQTGILNAITVALGNDPVGWLQLRQFNTFALIAIMIWLQTGFCMVILSAALKGIPGEVLDAARIDGADEIQIFFQIIIPALKTTIITVSTTVLIAVLKVFDIVFVMTGGQQGTEVIANRMFKEMFTNRNPGRASAIAVILLIAVIPVMVANVRAFRNQGLEH